jgi:hypothetical protein
MLLLPRLFPLLSTLFSPHLLFPATADPIFHPDYQIVLCFSYPVYVLQVPVS